MGQTADPTRRWKQLQALKAGTSALNRYSFGSQSSLGAIKRKVSYSLARTAKATHAPITCPIIDNPKLLAVRAGQMPIPCFETSWVSLQYGTLMNLGYDGRHESRISGSRLVSAPDAWVDDQIHNVGGEVDEDVGESDGEDASLEERVVAVGDGGDGE